MRQLVIAAQHEAVYSTVPPRRVRGTRRGCHSHFVGPQQAEEQQRYDDFGRVVAAVDVVTQEEILGLWRIAAAANATRLSHASRSNHSPTHVEDAAEVGELAVDVAADEERRLQLNERRQLANDGQRLRPRRVWRRPRRGSTQLTASMTLSTWSGSYCMRAAQPRIMMCS